MFRISRGERTETTVVVAIVEDGQIRGQGECVPYPRYGESVESVVAQLEEAGRVLGDDLTRDEVQTVLSAKMSQVPVRSLAKAR